MSSMRKAEGEELERKSIPVAVGEVELEGSKEGHPRREVEVHVKQRTTLTTKCSLKTRHARSGGTRIWYVEPKKIYIYMWRCNTRPRRQGRSRAGCLTASSRLPAAR